MVYFFPRRQGGRHEDRRHHPRPLRLDAPAGQPPPRQSRKVPIPPVYRRPLPAPRRPVIPFVRDGRPDFGEDPPCFLQHLGLYAYRRRFLLSLAALPPEPLEELEKLEQLRVLALGRRIHVGVVTQAGRGIDTPADYERFV